MTAVFLLLNTLKVFHEVLMPSCIGLDLVFNVGAEPREVVAAVVLA